MGGSKHAVIPSNPSRVIDPPAKWVERSNVNKNGSTSSARERHGLFRLGAFAAAHRRPVDPIFGSGIDDPPVPRIPAGL